MNEFSSILRDSLLVEILSPISGLICLTAMFWLICRKIRNKRIFLNFITIPILLAYTLFSIFHISYREIKIYRLTQAFQSNRICLQLVKYNGNLEWMVRETRSQNTEKIPDCNNSAILTAELGEKMYLTGLNQKENLDNLKTAIKKY